MKRRTLLALGASATAGGLSTASASPGGSGGPVPTDADLARSLLGGFRSSHVWVNGIRLHVVTGGRGEPLILLPGWPQTWWQFRKIMPALAEHRRVVAVDLRGMGGSDKPVGGYDKKTMARDIHELIRKLGYRRVDVSGHDIGAMVAFSLAANHPAAVRRVSLLDVPHPDDSMYDLTLVPREDQPFFLWWFAFNQVAELPEQLLTGQFRPLIDHLCGLILVDQDNILDRDRRIYADRYGSPDAIRGSNGWYQTFPRDIADQRTYPKVATPILGLASQHNVGYLNGPLSRHAANYQVVMIPDSGHYLAEEQPAAVVEQLLRFHR